MRKIVWLSMLLLASVTFAMSTPKIKPQTSRVEKKFEIAYPQLEGFYNFALQKKVNAYIRNHIDTWKPKEVDEKHLISKKIDYEVTLANQFLMSIRIPYSFTETGSAHPFTGVKALNIELRQGDEIPFFSLFESRRKFLPRLNEMVRERLTEKFVDKKSMQFDGVKAGQMFYITGKDLVLIFNPYDVGPASEGEIEIKIPLNLIRKDLTRQAQLVLF